MDKIRGLPEEERLDPREVLRGLEKQYRGLIERIAENRAEHARWSEILVKRQAR